MEPMEFFPDNDPSLASKLFPSLSEEQINALRLFGEELNVPAGTILFQRGERNINFYVILEGEAEIFAVDCRNQKHVLVIHRPGNFTGELSFFDNQKILVDGRTLSPCRVLCVHWQNFRRMLTAEPDLATIILRAFVLRRTTFIRNSVAGVTLVGTGSDPDTLRIRHFLTGVGYPMKWIRPDERDTTDGRTAMERHDLNESDLPMVWVPSGEALKNPSLNQLARTLGFLDNFSSEKVYDVAVVGAGPAGLAAGVCSASEGFETVIFDSHAPGGQASTSSRIENYLGFPNGISGQELAARAQVQAEKFGAQFIVASQVNVVKRNDRHEYEIAFNDHDFLRARCIIVASGATYRKLDVEGYTQFEGRGINYAATAMEAQLCAGDEVVIVGGGNSAGQAAIYLSQTAAKVHMLIRSRNLSSSMSHYLIERIEASPRIQLYYETEVSELSGDKTLEHVEWKHISGIAIKKPIRNLFVMIGANPNTSWLSKCTTLDPKGFVQTGLGKNSSPYETEQPGIFAVGDVRANSVKRVASAVGEGSIVIQWVYRYLQDLKNRPGENPSERRAA
jgi:thioredoxin reductase (NADPH)